MELLLEIRGDEIEVTEELLVITADNWTSSEVFFLLWESSPGIQSPRIHVSFRRSHFGPVAWNISIDRISIGEVPPRLRPGT